VMHSVSTDEPHPGAAVTAPRNIERRLTRTPTFALSV